TTHYMDEADYCDRLALIYRGKIIAEGKPADMRHKYMKRDVLELKANNLFDTMDILTKHGFETAIFGNSLHVVVENHEKHIPEIKNILEQAKIRFNKIEKIVPSLEDVFVTLIETS
ncbi:DUF4162 domain-containing protein, partial [Candidatus Desantisbacteria bacterium]|nr:DUF4162 domain-containing protein [Candidatus Desantisbacteria bacterium]